MDILISAMVWISNGPQRTMCQALCCLSMRLLGSSGALKGRAYLEEVRSLGEYS